MAMITSTSFAPAAEAALPRVADRGGSPEFPGKPRCVYALLKSTIDAVAAVTLLVVTGPVLLFSVALVKLTSAGPAFYSQTRLGRNGLPFSIYKLRTMYHKCESLTGACWSRPGDPRITPVGRFLRKSHIDELPQLWNVLRGDMSLIGPRPERPEFFPHLEQALPCYRARLHVKPGVSGLAQVQLPPDTNLESVRIKLAYDLHYIQHCTFWLDARLVLATVLKMLGLPFTWIGTAVGLPARTTIEAQYKLHCGAPRTPPAAPKNG